MARDKGKGPATGPDSLERWARETPKHHRALLLFAMQGQNFVNQGGILGRSTAAVAKSQGCHAITVGRLAKRKRWVERVLHHGEDAPKYALTLYRSLYLRDYGAEELPPLQHLLAVDAGPLDATRTEVQEEAMRLLRRVVPPPTEADAEASVVVKGKVEQERNRALEQNRAMMGVALRGLQQLDKAIKDGKVRFSIGDLGTLHTLLEKLQQEQARLDNPGQASTDSLAVADTVRVKLAKESGGDVLEAHWEDLEEARVVLGALRNRRDQPGDTIHAVDAVPDDVEQAIA